MTTKYFVGEIPLRKWRKNRNYSYQPVTRYMRNNSNYTDKHLGDYLKCQK